MTDLTAEPEIQGDMPRSHGRGHHAGQLAKGERVGAAAGTAGSIIFQWTAGIWVARVPLVLEHLHGAGE